MNTITLAVSLTAEDDTVLKERAAIAAELITVGMSELGCNAPINPDAAITLSDPGSAQCDRRFSESACKSTRS
ncbi:MAG: hypothetical protein WAL71_09365 [Terriglobales bacterium]|jgi:hypothetical protein